MGDSFTLRNENGTHFHVIVAESNPSDSANVMLVYLSSAGGYFRDTTTILRPGDHPFINKECWVRYQNILICTRDDVESKIVNHYGKVRDDVLEKIQNGIKQSNKTAKKFKGMFIEWNLERISRAINGED